MSRAACNCPGCLAGRMCEWPTRRCGHDRERTCDSRCNDASAQPWRREGGELAHAWCLPLNYVAAGWTLASIVPVSSSLEGVACACCGGPMTRWPTVDFVRDNSPEPTSPIADVDACEHGHPATVDCLACRAEPTTIELPDDAMFVAVRRAGAQHAAPGTWLRMDVPGADAWMADASFDVVYQRVGAVMRRSRIDIEMGVMVLPTERVIWTTTMPFRPPLPTSPTPTGAVASPSLF